MKFINTLKYLILIGIYSFNSMIDIELDDNDLEIIREVLYHNQIQGLTLNSIEL
jgi:hypothetical protein